MILEEEVVDVAVEVVVEVFEVEAVVAEVEEVVVDSIENLKVHLILSLVKYIVFIFYYKFF